MMSNILPIKLKVRLSVLYFMQFAVWGCYLTCFGQFLGASGLGADISWFYAAIGLVSVISPAPAGSLADRTGSPRVLLAACHMLAAAAMGGGWIYARSVTTLSFSVYFPLYLLFLIFYMPTLALANTASFALIKGAGARPVDEFPSIRLWGTVGFVAAMWFVNSFYFHNGEWGFTLDDSLPVSRFRFQYGAGQLLATAVAGALTALYALSLPSVKGGDLRQRAPLAQPGEASAGSFFADGKVVRFLVIVALGGMCLQISNGFVTPYISHFMAYEEYSGAFAAGNATMLFSLSQIAEAACILMVARAMRRLSIRWVMAIALGAWSLRFATLAFGNPGGGLWLLMLSMIAYGVAFNFFTIAGHLYMEQVSGPRRKGLGQGIMMVMSNGVGATLGTLGAGMTVNHWCGWQMVATPSAGGGAPEVMRLFMGSWEWPWLVFAGYAAAVGLLAIFSLKDSRNDSGAFAKAG